MPSQSPELIAVYGSLLSDMGGAEDLGVTEQLRLVGPCEIGGVLYDLGRYPGLVLGNGIVHGEIYELADPAVLERLDAYESYQPANPEGSLYIRRLVRLARPGLRRVDLRVQPGRERPADRSVWRLETPLRSG